MFCWSCGKELKDDVERCVGCGAVVRPVPGEAGAVPFVQRARVSVCPGCGYVGAGVPYFRRSTHAALLVGAALLTYGIGGLVYWLVKRDASICPSCGLSWDRSRPLRSMQSPEMEGVEVAFWMRPMRTVAEKLPRGGLLRRALGVILAILAVTLLGLGAVQVDAETAIAGISVGLVGVASFAWGWRAMQWRREELLRTLQAQVLQVAGLRGGRLTATDVAAELEVTLPAAERVLFTMDDGFRVRSDVTDEGLLVFDFPEIRIRGLAERAPGSEPPMEAIKPTEDE